MLCVTAGAKILHASARYQTVSAAVAPADLRDVAAVPRVGGVTESLAPIISSTCPGGLAVSEGDVKLQAAQARSTYGVDGSGVKIGILSDTFDKDPFATTTADEDVSNGDLPGPGNTCPPGYTTPVDTIDDTYTPSDPGDPEPSDEGRAMAQVVHDLAPGAQLSFATAFKGWLSFAGNINALADSGADVIVDDVIYLDEPFFQEGPVAVAVDKATADGAAYFSAAGNNNLVDGAGRNISSWETSSFRDSGSCPASLLAVAGLVGNGHCMDFDPGSGVDNTFGITVLSGETLTVDLQWAQPWYGVSTDLDAFLLNSSGNLLTTSGGFLDNVGETQTPSEVLTWTNNTGSTQPVQLVINRCLGATCNPAADNSSPRVKFALLQNGGGVDSTEYPQSRGGDLVGPTIFGHAGAANAMSVGAIHFNSTTAPAAYSSRGPVTHYFGPVSGVKPANDLKSPAVISKPDVVATDCNVTSGFFEYKASFRFCGTSAAAPHAAAIAALEIEAASPPPTPEIVKQIMRDTADPVGSFDACSVGSGIVNALAAVGAIKTPGVEPSSAICLPPISPPIPPELPAQLSAAVLRPLRTFISRHPGRKVFTRGQGKRVPLRFRSNRAGSQFLCKFDRGKFHLCPKKLIRWFRVGRHVIRVKARDSAGNVDPTPAVYRFRVVRKRIGSRNRKSRHHKSGRGVGLRLAPHYPVASQQ